MAAYGQNGSCRLEVEEAEEPERREAAWQSYGGAVVSRLVGNLEWLEGHISVLCIYSTLVTEEGSWSRAALAR